MDKNKKITLVSLDELLANQEDLVLDEYEGNDDLEYEDYPAERELDFHVDEQHKYEYVEQDPTDRPHDS